MKTVYVKTLSGEVIPVELSSYDTLQFSVERALDIKPGYRARLFDSDREEIFDAEEVFNGELLSVLVEPYDFTVSCMEVDRVEEPTSGTVFTKYMLEIDEGVRVYYYESTIGYLIERDVAFESFGELEFEPEHLLASLDQVLDRLFPEWDEEVREAILTKL